MFRSLCSKLRNNCGITFFSYGIRIIVKSGRAKVTVLAQLQREGNEVKMEGVTECSWKVTNKVFSGKAGKISITTQSYIVISLHSLLYLTIRHVVGMLGPIRSSGCEKGRQGLKDRRISAMTGMFPADRLQMPQETICIPHGFQVYHPTPILHDAFAVVAAWLLGGAWMRQETRKTC